MLRRRDGRTRYLAEGDENWDMFRETNTVCGTVDLRSTGTGDITILYGIFVTSDPWLQFSYQINTVLNYNFLFSFRFRYESY